MTPYWESANGAVLAELSFMQNVDTGNAYMDWTKWGYSYPTTTGIKYCSSNYGLGTMSARLTWKPVEGLKLTASAANSSIVPEAIIALPDSPKDRTAEYTVSRSTTALCG